MGELVKTLVTFLFDPGGSDLAGYSSGRLVFAIACSSIGFLIVLSDWAYTKTTDQESLLGLIYLPSRIMVVFTLWVLGAGVIGYIAVATELMQFTIQSCITIGVTWTILLPKIISGERGEAVVALPEDQETEEEA